MSTDKDYADKAHLRRSRSRIVRMIQRALRRRLDRRATPRGPLERGICLHVEDGLLYVKPVPAHPEI